MRISIVIIRLAKICPILSPEFIRPEKNRVWSPNLCLNLKFGQLVMSKFKSGSGSDLDIRVRVIRIFEPFRVRTNSDKRVRTTMFLCNFRPNSLENLIKTNLDTGLGY